MIEGEVSPLVAEKIYLYLSKVETQQLEEKQVITKIDRYHWFLFMALLCLMIDFLFPKIQLKYLKNVIIFLVFLISSNAIHASHPGTNAYNDQKFHKAEAQFKEALAKDPENGKITYNLGNTYFKLGDPAKSIKAYEEAIQLLPEKKKVSAYYNLGTSHLKNNNLEQALTAYKEVLKRNPDHLKTKQNIELALRQKSSQQKKSSQNNQKNKENNQDSSESNEQQANQNETDENNEKENNNQTSQTEETPKPSSEDEDPSQSEPPEQSNETLSEQQIQYLVDTAEKEAREKRQKKQSQLFEEATW